MPNFFCNYPPQEIGRPHLSWSCVICSTNKGGKKYFSVI